MKKLRNKIFVLAMLVFVHCTAMAQNMNVKQEEPTDFMRANGKIMVVLAVAVTIVAGLFIYLIALDRKITKLEKSEL